MMMENGNIGVTVHKKDLLTILRDNREKHRSVFLEALDGYREAAVRELDVMIEAAKSGGRILRAIEIVEPEDHTRDYDRAIRMLEMCVPETIFVNEHEFSCFVQDDWGWKGDFIAQTSNYSKKR
jgi:hypothetical protein